ncbi:MAG: hypothetical protein ACRCVI_02415 [Mycoplasmoidaceae bacterium]
MIKKKYTKKAILGFISISSLMSLTLPLVSLGNPSLETNNSNIKTVAPINEVKAAPTNLDTKFVYQDNYFLPIISEDGNGISLDSTKKIITLATPGGFLNWQVNIDNHPQVPSNNFYVTNGTITKSTTTNQEYYLFVLQQTGTPTNTVNLRIVFYDKFGTPVNSSISNEIIGFINSSENLEKKVALAHNKGSKQLYIFIPGRVSDFKGSNVSFSISDSGTTLTRNNPNYSGWSATHKLQDNNFVLGYAIPPYDSITARDDLWLIVNTAAVTGKNWLTAVKVDSRSLATLETEDYSLDNASQTIAKMYAENSAQSNPLSLVSINFTQIYTSMSPVTFFSRSSNNIGYTNFMFNIPSANNENGVWTTKFFVNPGTQINQVDANGIGNAYLNIGEDSGLTRYVNTIVSPYDGDVNVLLFKNNDFDDFRIERVYLDYWLASSRENQSSLVVSNHILGSDDSTDLKGIDLVNLLVRKVNLTSYLSLYQKKGSNFTAHSVSDINIQNSITGFDPIYNFTLPNNYFYIDTDFQKRARELNWVATGGGSAKRPSQVIESMTVGNSNTDFFKPANGNFTIGDLNPARKGFITSDVVTDDEAGTFSATFRIFSPRPSTPGISSVNRIFAVNYKVSLTDLLVGDRTTAIMKNPNADYSSTIPTNVSVENIEQFVSIINAPTDATKTFEFSNGNNITGTLTVKVTLSKHFLNGLELSTPLVETINFTEFAKIKSTNVIQNPDAKINNLTVHEINATIIPSLVLYTDLPPGSTEPTIFVLETRPLLGEILIQVSFYQYYDASGYFQDVNSGARPLLRGLTIRGFKKIEGATTYSLRDVPGIQDIFVYDVSNDNFFDYIAIHNRVPESTITFKDIIRDDGVGNSIPGATPSGEPSVTFTFTLSKVYNTLGDIVNGTEVVMKVTGFAEGNNTLATTFVKKPTNPLVYPFQVNETNITTYLVGRNVPEGADVSYNFQRKQNVNRAVPEKDGGILTVIVTCNPHLNIDGRLIDGPLNRTFTFEGFRSNETHTTVSALSPNQNVYASSIDSTNYHSLVSINNPVGLISVPTSMLVEPSDVQADNKTGIVKIEYYLLNYFEPVIGEFVAKSSTKFEISITGFRNVNGPTGLEVTNHDAISRILPGNFVLNNNNYTDFFKLVNFVTPSIGSDLNETIIKNIKIDSYDNAKGEVTVSLVVNGKYYDSKLIPQNPGGKDIEILQTFSGFRKGDPVNPLLDNLPLLIGGASGGIAAIILLIVASIFIAKNVKKRKYEAARKNKIRGGDTKGGAGPTSGMPRPTVSVGGPAQATRPIPGATRPIPGATRPIPPSATRPIPTSGVQPPLKK